ncbi:MAG: sigma-54-dependent Fis family transcriptional regulator [Bdellovibrionales bacterium]|nr:sigma-54-dependent Fis family transcriptional regulator [Bdellovibrionales bacterium]
MNESILVVEDTPSLRDVLAQVLSGEGYAVNTTATAEEALELIGKTDFTMVLSDLKLPGKSGLDLIADTRAMNKRMPIVVMTAFGSIDIAVDAMKLGATDFITKPFDPEDLCQLIGQIVEHRRIIDRSSDSKHKAFVTQNDAAADMLMQAKKVAPLGCPVLILGESGTGKELVARYIHEQSPRTDERFVAVNCGSMPSDLLESEFFGHEAGAFTGANEQRVGLFEVATHGTIFLDEIANMPANLQTKLLRALQESEIKRLGSTKMRKINTRVISATNADLEKEISEGKFREDLYYRLGVVILEVPPLRRRPEDIPLLANYFVKRFSQEFERPTPALSGAVLKKLANYRWPGNVRELENAVCRAMILSEGPLKPDSFELKESCVILEDDALRQTLPEAIAETVRRTETEIITKALSQTYGNKSKAAEILGVSYKTLLNKVKEYDIEVPNFRGK